MFEYTKKDIEKKSSKKLSSSTNLTGIPDTIKTHLENLSGLSFDDVRVHYNSNKPAQLQALAYAQGNRVYISSGQKKHLCHELGHVVQQKRGVIKPTLTKENIKINNDKNLEKEADNISIQIVQRHTISKNSTEELKQITPYSPLIQCVDPVEKAIMPENFDKVRIDINNAMKNIKNAINIWAEKNKKVGEKLETTKGRDAWVYASDGILLKGLLDAWNDSWPFENTCGLLLDLGNALQSYASDINIMNDYMKESRSKKHKIDKNSNWVKELPPGAKTMSGVSATTGNLLRMLSFLSNDIKLHLVDIEAIVIGAIKYWKFESWTISHCMKWLSGSYHTASEVWSVYTYFLENQLIKECDEKLKDKD